jgi:N-acetylneuraminic acid mutarotase
MGSLGGKVVLFGGLTATGPLSDTWTFDGKAWTRVPGAGPSGRAWSVMAPLDGKLVLLGGFGGTIESGSVLSDTWTFDGDSWTKLDATPPRPARWISMMAPFAQELVLFGGVAAGSADAGGGGSGYGGSGSGSGTSALGLELADTWSWNGSAWSLLTNNGPSARASSAMAELNGTVVLFGGYLGETALSDTWTWNGTMWSEPSIQGPPARYAAAVGTL